MKRAVLRGRLFFLWIVLLLLLTSSQAWAARVRFVPDGDTIVTAAGEVVRLAGIDAPEMSHDGEPAGLGSDRARLALSELVLGREIEIIPHGNGRDRYGRTLALVRLPDGRMAQEVLVARGLAFVYPFPDQEAGLAARLVALQREALERGRGFWPELLNHSRGGGYVGNARSKRFGNADCQAVSRIGRRNRIFFADLKEAFLAGFSPYRECGLWPEK